MNDLSSNLGKLGGENPSGGNFDAKTQDIRTLSIKCSDKPIVFLMGPTASGKTALAIELFQQGQVEIISVDSAMVYQQMNIGSAKPSDRELVLAPHHLIDFIDPKNSYSAANFCQDATALINKIHACEKIPLLVGGTMLYFKALRDGLADLPETDVKIRAEIKQQLSEKGVEFLYHELAKVDKKTADRLHINDSQRITRALEVFQMTEKTLSQWHQEQKRLALPNPLLSIALAPTDRSILHKRIALRFEKMLEKGLIEEVTRLYHRGDLNLDCPSMRSVGYRQIWQYLQGELSLPEAKEKAIIATRQLAKRQYTWLRSWHDAKWFDPTNSDDLESCRLAISHFIASNV